MVALRSADLVRLAEAMRAMLQPVCLSELPNLMVRSLAGLVDGPVGLAEVDVRGRRHRYVTEPHDLVPAGLNDVMERLLPEHPLVRHFERTSSTQATRFSDVLSLRELKRLPIYQDCYRHVGFDRLMSVTLPARHDLILGLNYGRSGPDFTDTDVQLADLARPHLVLSFQVAQSRQLVDAAVLALEHVDDTAYGIVLLGSHGQARVVNAAARRLLTAYFRRGCDAGRALPDELVSWLAAQRQRPGREDPRPPRPYLARRGGRTITVTLIGDGSAGALLLAETGDGRVGAAPAVDGLTRREGEVLWLAAHGATSGQIARRLTISPRTVEAHLAHVYAKIGVQSRTAAAFRVFGPLALRRPGDSLE
jgi:DNA-binding CsgD family transcriptional regulator